MDVVSSRYSEFTSLHPNIPHQGNSFSGASILSPHLPCVRLGILQIELPFEKLKRQKRGIAVPTLRPTTAGPQRQEKRHMFKLTTAETPRNGGVHIAEIQLTRNLFQDARPQTGDPEKSKSRKPRTKSNLKPIKPEKTPRRRPVSSEAPREITKPAPKQQQQPLPPPPPPEPAFDPDMKQLEMLAKRLQTSDADLTTIADRIAPTLDRILCTVTDMGPKRCVQSLDDPVIVDLHQKLFPLIEVDDFLTRVIVCRILLNFASDKSSPLLLPISTIFFKLSCDSANLEYFAEEKLESVILTLIMIGEKEVKVNAAGALRNIIVSGTIRERLVESDLFAIGFDVFHDKCEDERLKIQVVGIFKRMCKEEKFRQKVAESHFLTMAANDKPCYCPVLKVAAHLPEMSKEEKLDFMDAFARIEYANDDLIDSTLKAFPIVSSGIEDCEDCAMAINKLLKVVGSNVDGASMLLDTAMKCESVIEILHSDGIYVALLESSEYDSAMKRKVCELMRKFNDPVLEPLIDAHSEPSKAHV